MSLFGSPDDPRWQLLAATEKKLAEASDRAAVIEVVRSTARLVFAADGVCFILREGERCHYVEEDAIGPLWKGQSFPISSCVSGWSMVNMRTAVIEDVFADPRVPQDAYRPTFVKSMIMTPAGEKSPVAAIGAYWASKRSFSERDIAVVKMLGEAVGRALAPVS